MEALNEVHPAFGVSEEELQQVVQNGIIHFDPIVDVSLYGIHYVFSAELN
jgi:vesicle-fusing ATPase